MSDNQACLNWMTYGRMFAEGTTSPKCRKIKRSLLIFIWRLTGECLPKHDWSEAIAQAHHFFTSCFLLLLLLWHFAQRQATDCKQACIGWASSFIFTSFSWHFVGRQASKFKQAWFAPTSCLLETLTTYRRSLPKELV